MSSMYLLFSPAVPTRHFLLLAMFVVVSILFALTVFMLLYLVRSRKAKRKKEGWRKDTTLLIERAIYFEPSADGPEPIPVPFRVVRGLKVPEFRQLLISELVKAKKALSGSAGDHLMMLFTQLSLQEDARRKLDSPKWHLQALGIQELAVMHQRQHLIKIYRLTNDKHELVRMEAQSAIVQLYGFEGLRFLDVIDHAMSDWQQMKLLHLLANAGAHAPDKMVKWLTSSNVTVRIFALKLIEEHHFQELHAHVLSRLEDDAPAVRMQAVRCLRQIYDTGTVEALIRMFPLQDQECRLLILDTIGQIGAEEHGDFLARQLTDAANMLKLSAARALAAIGGTAVQILDQFPLRDQYPWNLIIQQVKPKTLA